MRELESNESMDGHKDAERHKNLNLEAYNFEAIKSSEPSDRTDRDSISQYPDRQLPAIEITSSASDIVTRSDVRVVKSADGSYSRDSSGRVFETVSADGSLKRSFKYEDSQDPDRITSEIVNDKTEYRFIGRDQVLAAGSWQPFSIEGKECNSYAVYENNRLVGNWSGVRSISSDGIYASKELSPYNTGPVKYFDRNGRELTAGQKIEAVESAAPQKRESLQAAGTKSGTAKSETGEIAAKRDAANAGESSISRPEGLYKRDAQGRLTEMQSADGRLKREFKYEDPQNPQRISREIVNNKTEYRFLAQDRILGKNGWEPYKIKDLEVSSYSVYENGQLVGNWDGIRAAGSGGVYSTAEARNGSMNPVMHFDAGGNVLSEEQMAARQMARGQQGPARQEAVEQGAVEQKAVEQKAVEQKAVEQKRPAAEERELPGKRSDDGSKRGAEQGTEEGVDQEKPKKADEGDQSPRHSSQTFEEARKDLLVAADAAGINKERMVAYISDLQKNADLYQVRPEQMAKALDNLREILKMPSGKYYSREQLKVLAETAMHNIARPREIDQGYHPTCNVTTLEVHAAAKHPDEYTRLCKEIAQAGRYKTESGVIVTPPKAALLPGEDEREYKLNNPNVDVRNFASQVVQMTLINGAYETGGVVRREVGSDGVARDKALKDHRYILDKITWVQEGPNTKRKIGEDRLIDGSGKIAGKQEEGPGFSQLDTQAAARMMLGHEMPYTKPPYKVDSGPWNYDLPDAARLLKAKQQGQFPMGVATMGGGHVQTIHDVRQDVRGSTWVLLDNQRGAERDGWISLEELHKTQITNGYESVPGRRSALR